MSGAPVETPKAELIAPVGLEVRQLPAWNKENKLQAETSNRLKNYAFALLCVLNLSTLGVLLGVASWFGPAGTPLFFAIVVSEYTDRGIPPIPFAQNDKDILVSGSVFERVQTSTDLSPTRQSINGILNRIESVSASENVVLYVEARAVTAQDGTVAVLPSEATVSSLVISSAKNEQFDIQGAVKLSEIFNAMALCPARQKLLILDVFHMFVNLPAGSANFDIPYRALSEYKAHAEKNAETPSRQFNLLMSCQPGQRSMSSQVLKGGIFRHFFTEAIAGRLPYPVDCMEARRGKIVLSEICEIIGPHMDRWAAENELERQTPLLIGPANHFVLSVPVKPGAAESKEESPAELPAPIREAWELLEGISPWKDNAISPRIHARLFSFALNSTIDYSTSTYSERSTSKYSSELSQIKKMIAEEQSLMVVPGSRPTLGLLDADGLLDNPSDTVKILLAGMESLHNAPEKPDEAAKVVAGLVADFMKTNADKPKALVENAAINAAITHSECNRLHMMYLAGVVTAHHRPAIFAEGRLLVRLSQSLDKWPFDPDLIRTTISSNQIVNVAMAKWNVYRWLGKNMDEMAEQCMSGTWLVENSPVEHRAEALRRLERAHTLALFVNGFDEVIRSAVSDIEKAIIDLSNLLAYPIILPAGVDEYADRCQDLVNMGRILARSGRLAPQQAGDIIGRVRLAARKLRGIRDIIHQPVSTQGIAEYERLINEGSLSPATLIELTSMVRLVDIPKENRFKLMKLRNTLVTSLAASTLEKESNETFTKAPINPLPAYDPTDPSWASWRGRIEVARLKLAEKFLKMSGLESPSIERIRILLSKIDANASPGSSVWGEMGELFRRIYIREIPEFVKSHEPQSRLLNMLYPGWMDLPLLDSSETNPLAKERRSYRLEHIIWLESRFRHMALLGIDDVFWKEQTRLVIGKYPGTVGPAVYLKFPESILPPLPDKPIEVEVRWYVGGVGSVKPKASIVPADASPLDAAIVQESTGPEGGFVRVRISQTSKSAQELLGTASQVVVEFSEAGRVWPVLLNILPDPAAGMPLILLSDNADGISLLGDDLMLRGSGSVRSLFPSLRARPGKAASISAMVRLEGTTTSLAGPVNLNIPAGMATPLTLSALMGSSQTAGAPPAAAPAGATPAEPAMLRGYMPSKMVLELRDLTNPTYPPLARRFSISRVDPADIVELVSATTEPDMSKPGASLLRVGLRARKPPLNNPPCRVELILDNGASGNTVKLGPGNTKGVLPADGATLFLEQGGILGGNRTGQFTISIDGTPMLFRLKADLEPQSRALGADLVRKPVMGLTATFVPPAADPLGKNQPSEGSIAINAWATSAPAGCTLNLALLGGPAFTNLERAQSFPAGLKSELRIVPGEAGAWNFSCTESTWRVNWDIEGLKGAKRARLQLVAPDGKVLDTMFVNIMIDPNPIRFVDIVGLPSMVSPGASYSLVAVLQASESGIREVVAFMGAPVANALGVPEPPEAATIFTTTLKGNLATSILAIPADAKAPFVVTLKATSGAGVSTVLTRTLPLGPPKPPAEPSVEGLVSEGDRPQAGIEVSLLDAKGMKVAATKTDAGGLYRFENLKKGKYTVQASKGPSGRKASKPVTLEPGPPMRVDLVLLQ